MEILAFVLIGGIWAAFLLPSFVENRQRAPINSTRSFARNTALLASVAGNNVRDVMLRRQVQERRRKVLYALSTGAVVTLGMAIWRDSVTWLGATVVFDLALGGYVALLLGASQRRSRTGRVLSLGAHRDRHETIPEPEPTVRVVAG
ncbi:MAG: hypothetical protein PVI35_06705 [Acidimicrobiia bacterium]|jgi:hypothetical protein